jgi:hypothetical protein
MTSILGRIFGAKPPRAIEAPAAADAAYVAAMRESDDLLAKMRAAYGSTDPVRQAMADIWAQHHNIPFMTTIHETVQEMNAPLKQKP